LFAGKEVRVLLKGQAKESMISNGEKDIKTIVAVWYDKKKKKFHDVIPPCGKCREMIKQTSKKNQNTNIIISNSKKVKTKELLPHSWGGSLDQQ
jgi:cytidine deaminase